jgi:predicted cupin superfamily sugar epimerase
MIAGVDRALPAEQVIQLLGLQRHPEGGWFRETWRDPAPKGGRGTGTAIYYLLPAGERSHWHRVDAVEIWHWYAGSPLALQLSSTGQAASTHLLGPDLASGARPQIIVPAEAWQAAESLGAWTLVGCTVSPGFSFEGFELAPPDWQPSA